MLETLDYTIRIGSIPTFLYFDLYLYSAYAAHFVYFTFGSFTAATLWLISRSVEVSPFHSIVYVHPPPTYLFRTSTSFTDRL